MINFKNIFFALLIVQTFVWAKAPEGLENSLMRITVTYQEGSAYVPWRWKSPKERSAQGLVVAPDLVLVLSALVMDSTHIEARLLAEPSPTVLKVSHVDFDRGLALLQGTLPKACKVITLPTTSFFQQGAEVKTFWKSDDGKFMEGHGKLDRAESARSEDSHQMQLWYEGSNVSVRGGFGEPVFCAGNLIGIGCSNGSGAEMSVLPVEMIHARYELPSGRLKPDTAMSGFITVPCKATQLRRNKGLGENDGGCLILDVMEQGSGHLNLQKGDVLLAFNGRSLDAWGRYDDAKWGWQSWELLMTQLTLDQKPVCTVMRDGKKLDLNLTLSTISEDQWVVPSYRAGETPRYFIRGGFVFQNLSLAYVRAWGKDWTKVAPDEILSALDEEHGKVQNTGLKEIVLVSQVLSHPINMGLQGFGRQVISRVNDVDLVSLDQLKSLLDDPKSKMIKLSLRPGQSPLLLDPAELRKADADIAKWYSITTMENLK